MSAATVTEIYLVRHGETDWNREQRLQGRIDTPLNRIGLAQAGQVADRFRALTGATVVTSPLARARDTARTIARGKPLGIRDRSAAGRNRSRLVDGSDASHHRSRVSWRSR